MFCQYPFSLMLIAFASLATAADVDSYEKCSGIKAHGERLKCYDSSAKQGTKRQSSIASSKEKNTGPVKAPKLSDTNVALRRDMQSLLNTPMAKGELETTSEYKERVRQMYEKYDKRPYKVEIDVKEHNISGEKIVSYNPDTQTLTVSMPKLAIGSVGMQIGDKSEKFTIARSFLATEPAAVKISSYTSRSGLGQEVTVEKYDATFQGIAILGSRNNDKWIPQNFTTTISRDRAKDILDRGKVLINVRTELLMYGEGTYLLDDWLLGKEASLLVRENNIDRKPTMQNPRDMQSTTIMLPVRLVSISLLDGNGAEVLQAQGTEQDTPAIKKGY